MAFDFIVRLKVGGTDINHYIVYQLPALPPSVYDKACSWGDG